MIVSRRTILRIRNVADFRCIIPVVFYVNEEGVGTSKHNCLCICFSGLTTCFGHILRSQKYIMRKTIQYKIISCGTYSELSTRSRCYAVCPYWTNNMFDILLVISLTWTNRITTRICTTTNELILYSFPHYIFLWPEVGPQWPKHVVSLIKQIQRQLCFDVPTPS